MYRWQLLIASFSESHTRSHYVIGFFLKICSPSYHFKINYFSLPPPHPVKCVSGHYSLCNRHVDKILLRYYRKTKVGRRISLACRKPNDRDGGGGGGNEADDVDESNAAGRWDPVIELVQNRRKTIVFSRCFRLVTADSRDE